MAKNKMKIIIELLNICGAFFVYVFYNSGQIFASLIFILWGLAIIASAMSIVYLIVVFLKWWAILFFFMAISTLVFIIKNP